MRFFPRTFSGQGDTFSALERFESEMGRMLDAFAVPDSSGLFDRNVTPAVDVIENQDGFRVFVDLPGVERKDLELSLAGNVLSLKGEKREEKGAQGGNLFRKETWSGCFRRTISLPDSVDPDKVKAELKDGVLSVEVGKKEALKPRLVAVEAK